MTRAHITPAAPLLPSAYDKDAPRTEVGSVRQSFSHARSKTVTVEVKRRRAPEKVVEDSIEADEFARIWSTAFAVAKREAIEDLLNNGITPHGTSEANPDHPER